VCFRQECNNGQYNFGDFRAMWLPMEVLFAFVFTLEVIVRFFVARNMLMFWTDAMNLLDVASILPFYIEWALSVIDDVPMNFTISTADSTLILMLKILKVTRVFKMTRHFSGTLVLADTFKRSTSKVRASERERAKRSERERASERSETSASEQTKRARASKRNERERASETSASK
jgi:hypothetical protein